MEVNKIYEGDCLIIMEDFPDNCVDLIYADPPYFSQTDYGGFNDVWVDLQQYLKYMKERLLECHRVLKSTGSIYLHCDWHASHYLKIIMDEIFDYKNFRNEIIWCYTGPSNTKDYFPRKHDIILFYTKTNKWTFNGDVIKIHYKKLKTGKTSGIFKQNYVLDKNGKIPEDWWDEFSPVGRLKKELLGYPTQKPEALLDRIIKASSNEGDLVLDPFCGCGTTCAVGLRLKRKVIGIDISPQACIIANKRIEELAL